MAYEDKTVEALTGSLLENVDDSFDKREGSVAHDLLVPNAIELSLLYTELASVLLLGFADTTEANYLDLRAGEFGVTRKAASKSVGSVTLSGADGTVIATGTRLITAGVNPIYFVTTAAGTITSGSVTVTAEAEVDGVTGNIATGAIVSLAEGNSVISVTNAAPFDGGADAEDDASLLGRYKERVMKPATSGNSNDYLQWAKEVAGVGDAKVYPLWNGNGTVKVVLLDADKTAPPSQTVTDVTTYIESVRPIGATVTVVGATETAINVTTTLTLKAGSTLASAQTEIETGLVAYLKTLAFVDPLVRYSRIANVILDASSVVDYANLTVNGGTTNITIADGSVAVKGSVALS